MHQIAKPKRETIKMAKNPIGNHKGLGIGHRGKTCQNEPPSEKQSIYEHIYEQRDKQCKEEKTFCESGMTCQQPISHDSYHSACKIEETTDEQSISEQVRGKPEDQHTATECVCCPVCPQLICLCCQECGGPDKGIHCPKITPENSRKLSAGARISKDPYGPEILVPYKDGQFSHFQLPTLCRIFLLPLV